MAVKSRSTRKKAKQSLLPESFQAFIARRMVEVFSLTVLALAIFSFISCASFSTHDPSLNTSATGGDTIYNWAGIYGAYFADIIVQTFGFSAFFIPLILMFWSGRLFRKIPFDRFSLRFCAFLVLLCVGSAFFGTIPSFAGWPLGERFGGSVGFLFVETLLPLLDGVVGRFTHYFLSFVTGVLTAVAFGYASHVSLDKWKQITRLILKALSLVVIFVVTKLMQAARWIKIHGFKKIEDPEATGSAIITWLERKFIHAEEAIHAEKTRVLTKPEPRQEPVAEKKKPLTKIPSLVKSQDEQEVEPKQSSIQIVAPEKNRLVPADEFEPTQLDTYHEFQLPSLDLLQKAQVSDSAMSEEELHEQAEALQDVLNDFGVKGEIVKVHPGPVVTLYELEPAPGTKSSRVISLSEDIARSMEAISVRAAVIPGKNAIGIEIPNSVRETVYLREILSTKTYHATKNKLPLVLGKDIGGHPILADLAKMPHLLVAGTTGSGKSVAVNTMILSLLYHHTPEKCRFIMIDPKMLELAIYDGIPHLLSPVVTEPGKAVVALKWAVREMEERYRSMSKLGVRNIDGYNMRIKQAIEKGEILTRNVQTGFDADTGKPVFEEQQIELKELPYIVIIVDEFADLMMVAGKDVEAAIQRLAQMARAAGIHLIMATQRPSVDVVTGTVKANFPTRISFQVTSKIDSRTILGEGGAESLLGMGDMLYMASGGRITRVHGPFASDDEVEKVVRFLKSQGEPDYLDDVTDGDGDGGDILGLFGDSNGGKDGYDDLYDEAVAIVAREQKASTSYIQRQLQIGYNRAARIIEQMEKDGVIGKANHVGKREILIGER